MPDVTQSPYRLPKTVTPSHYELTLEPNLMNFTFAGTEAVNIAVVEPTDVMVVNAIEIEIDEAWVSGVTACVRTCRGSSTTKSCNGRR